MKLVIDLATLKGWLQILSITLPLILLVWANIKLFKGDLDEVLLVFVTVADAVLIVMIITFVYPWIWG